MRCGVSDSSATNPHPALRENGAKMGSGPFTENGVRSIYRDRVAPFLSGYSVGDLARPRFYAARDITVTFRSTSAPTSRRATSSS